MHCCLQPSQTHRFDPRLQVSVSTGNSGSLPLKGDDQVAVQVSDRIALKRDSQLFYLHVEFFSKSYPLPHTR